MRQLAWTDTPAPELGEGPMPIQYKQAGKTAGICCVVVLTALVARAADDGWPVDVRLALSDCAIA